MSFLEPASLGLAATLTPAGIYCINLARKLSTKCLLLACIPLGFAGQQAIEGLVWHGINQYNPQLILLASRGFVFFSHFFWLFYVPLASLLLETNRANRVLLSFRKGQGVRLCFLFWRIAKGRASQ